MRTLALMALALLVLSGCATRIPDDALAMSEDDLQLRQLQTRAFDTTDEAELIAAGASVLQDLGFTIQESEVKLGVLVGEKDRSAKNAAQIAGATAVALLTGAWIRTDEVQKIRASLVTKPRDDESSTLRVTFQRLVWGSDGKLTKVQSLEQPELYQEFFIKLSQAVFLEANEI